MNLWYICDGEVKEYCGQKANWDTSVIVPAESMEAAFIKAILYYRSKSKFYNRASSSYPLV